MAKHSIVEFILPETHLFSVQVQLVSFKDLSNSLILSEYGWHFGSSWTGHKGLHSVPLIWWHWHRSVQLDVVIDWLTRNVWLWYWHKRAKTQLTMWNKQAEEEEKPNHLMYNIAKGLLDSFYFSVNGNECQWSFLFKIFVFFKVDLTILVTISVKTFLFLFFFRFLVSFYFLFYFGAVWVSLANERMLCMLIHNYQRRKSRGVFILIFMGNSLIFWMQKMGTVN